MKCLACDLCDGECVNCSGTREGARCPATVTMAVLHGMYFGTLPQRAVRLTRVQLRALQSLYEQEGGRFIDLGRCIHRGDKIRNQVCTSCPAKPRIKVFACAVHGECTIGKRLDGLACCAGCLDRAARETGSR